MPSQFDSMVHTPSICQQQLCFPCHLCSTSSDCSLCLPLLHLFSFPVFHISMLPITKLWQKSPRPVVLDLKGTFATKPVSSVYKRRNGRSREVAHITLFQTRRVKPWHPSSWSHILATLPADVLVPCQPLSLHPFCALQHSFIFWYFSHHLSLVTKFWWSLLLGRL